MLKSLLKKQLAEMTPGIFRNTKTGKNRSLVGKIGIAVLFLFVIISFTSMFFGMSYMLCAPLVGLGLGWMYFSLMSMLTLMLGIFGGIFTSYSTLYAAKDNDLLLSMPIPPSKILFARIFAVWTWGTSFSAIAFIPAAIAYAIVAKSSPLSWISCAVLFMCITLLALVLTCILGWGLAKINKRLKGKNYITVALSLLFFAVYYYLIYNVNGLISIMLANAIMIGDTLKDAFYPIYMIGRAAQGDLISLLFVVAIAAVCTAAVFWVLSNSFIKLATANSGDKKKKYVHTAHKVKGLEKSLLGRELKRYLSSSPYMLNSSISVIFLVAGGIALLFNAGQIIPILDMLDAEIGEGMGVMLLAAGISLLAAMNDISAPSISLEGRTLWIVKSLPIAPTKIFSAKIKLHIWIVAPPTLFCSVVAAIAVKANPFYTAVLIIQPLVFVVLFAIFGFVCGLKMPNLTWTNETVVVKQGGAVMLSMFGGMLFPIVIGAIGFMMTGILGIYLTWIVQMLILVGIIFGLIAWLNKRGGKIFAQL